MSDTAGTNIVVKTMRQFKAAMVGKMMQVMPGMITCVEFDQLITDYIDDTLPPDQKRIFERHLRICPHCQEYMAAYQESRRLCQIAYGEDHDPVIPSDVPQELMDAVLASVRKG